jgi:glycosyltransferase involved in cell wall biosynthesis
MRLIMTLLVRNEEDIIRENLEFHLSQGVDHVIVTDNNSTDGTVEVLQQYEGDGRVTVLFEHRDDHSQGRWVTRMARLAVCEYGADWLINNDADEFWWPRRGTLKSTLEAMPAEVGVLAVGRSNFPPVAEESGPFYRRLVLRESISRNSLGKPLPPKVCHRCYPDVEVRDGNHGISTEFPAAGAATDAIEILHFPMRTYRQFESKIRLGGAALNRNKSLAQGIGRTWRYLYGEYRAGRLGDYYRSQMVDAQAVRAGLRDGSLVEDHRLRQYLERLPAMSPAGRGRRPRIPVRVSD